MRTVKEIIDKIDVTEQFCEDCTFECDSTQSCLLIEAATHLRRLNEIEDKFAVFEDAAKQGRLVIWPCSTDKTCYAIVQLNCEYMDCPKQNENGDCDNDCPNIVTEIDSEKTFFADLIRLPLYATREAAEAALKEADNG